MELQCSYVGSCDGGSIVVDKVDGNQMIKLIREIFDNPEYIS